MAIVEFTVKNTNLNSARKRMQYASEKAKHATALQMAKDTDPYVPASSVKLLARATRVENDTIIYPGPYARYLYYGKLMIDPKTGSSFATKGASKVVTGTKLQYSHAVHSKAQDHWFEAAKAQNKDKWVRFMEKAVTRYPG